MRNYYQYCLHLIQKSPSNLAICKSRNWELGNQIRGMIGIRGIRAGMRGFRVGMQGIGLGMWGMWGM